MNELKELLGEKLYYLVQEKVGQKELLVNDGKLIPKHRFDCINISLKEHKEKCLKQANKIQEIEKQNKELLSFIDKIKKLQCEIYILKHLMNAKVLNYSYVRSLLKLEGLSYNSVKKVLNKRLKHLQETEPTLFYENNNMYMLVPYKKIITRNLNE